ncbi:hypothetical protein C7H19_21780 [Aphanothece hegewaldii CCALA 016]|uniref:DUF4359 domain-containing protein n=1 Tax=Aphanothece hegewaldii CCALA 016 TaxID=2107694 RepID=A0A2T1LSD6_9CHRO|nr:DUF4359 domain-containing protein [Aphanothece hegewaldii]PSF32277.1 hypothetical protein C7H19_21780 [Aphanothece hegewaldii CCALA 016]
MKFSHLLSTCTGITLTSFGVVMVMTNPGQVAYEQYAAGRLTTYLKEDLCLQIKENGELKGVLRTQCKNLVDTGRPQLEQVITLATKRQNFVLFSIYQTELELPSPVPSYQFDTIAILQNFYTYQAMEM